VLEAAVSCHFVTRQEHEENQGFLEKHHHKLNSVIVTNAGCAFTCPSNTCYVSFSKMNKGDKNAEFICSQASKEREQLGVLDFELAPLVEMGFKSFKLLCSQPGQMTGF